MSKYFFTIPLSISLFFLLSASTIFNPLNNTTEEEYNPLPCLNKTFPIAIQIMRDSLGEIGVEMADIQESINSLNELFEPICASFSITDTRIIENEFYDLNSFQTEIYQNMASAYNKPFRINIYIGEQVAFGDYTQSRATYEGIAQAPDSYPAIGVNKIAFPNFDTRKYLAHAVGSYFGLRPTSYEETELVDGSNCAITGDNICDTPADPFNPILTGEESGTYIDICRFQYPLKDANDEFYNPDVSNIMSYYTRCRCVFTQEQYQRMANTYLNNPGNTW